MGPFIKTCRFEKASLTNLGIRMENWRGGVSVCTVSGAKKNPVFRSCFFCKILFLIYRVLQLMNLTDSRLSQSGCEKLDLAILSFFEQFRKIYVGDQVQKSSKVSTVKNRGEKGYITSMLKYDIP